MKKRIYILLCILSIGICSFAQKKGEQALIQKTVSNLYTQLLTYPQEKIYLQTDKPYYMNGEKMFFRAFVFDASTLCAADWSRYIYVELISPTDSVVLQQQIRYDKNKMFYGALNLPETLPEGNYSLRAYSRYLENSGEEFFYAKSVFIGDPNASNITIDDTFTKIDDDNVKLELAFKNKKTKTTIQPENLNLTQNKEKANNFKKPNVRNATYEEKFNLKNDISRRIILIDYKDKEKSFKKYITVPFFNSFPDIHFYPEGGQLIAGVTSRVAFKALLPGAEPTTVEGTIYNTLRKEITTFSTQQKGMGTFTFTPIAGEKYYAQCNYKGQTMKIDLPDVQTEGYAVQTNWEADSLCIKVNYSPNISPGKCYLLVHHQGVPAYIDLWNFSQPEIRLSKNLFTTGVNHVLLLDSAFMIKSERLVFNNLNDLAVPKITATKSSYSARKKVDVNIKFNSKANDSLPPNFAIAVTDDNDVKLDTTTNIVSEILLSSELKGTISNPASYFRNDPKTAEAADLLMMTNGWRSYHIKDILQNDLQKPTIKPERSYSVSGTVRGWLGKKYKKGKVSLTALKHKFADVTRTDENGRFEFSNYEFPDSTVYFLMSLSSKGTEDGILDIRLDSVPLPAVTIPVTTSSEFHVPQVQMTEYLTKANSKYRYEKGLRQIDLPEVVIKKGRREARKRINNQTIISNPPNAFISSEEIERNPPVHFSDLFARLPGVMIKNGDSAFVPGAGGLSGKVTNYMLDGFAIKTSSLQELEAYVNPSEIAQVDLYKTITDATILGGVTIALTRWDPAELAKKKLNSFTNRKLIMPLGYQKPVEFYSPKYDTPEMINNHVPDLRSTIYWKPNVQTDSIGKASVNFYSADAATTYSVVVEGFTNDKKLVYSRKNAIVQVK